MENMEISRSTLTTSRYSNFTDAQRKVYIQNVNANKKKQKQRNSSTEEVNDQRNASNSITKRRTSSHICAQLVAYQYQGQTIYDPVCSPPHKLPTMSTCKHCGAMKFQYESPTFCCHNGQIRLATLNVPDELYNLYTAQTEEAIHFRQHIRAYNSIFSFTSFGVNLDKELTSSRRGVYTFRAQGQIYHHLPSLIPEENRPCYFQLYFYDTENEVQNRMSILQGAQLNRNIVEKLQMILETNPYVQFLRRLKDYPCFDDFEIRIRKDVRLDQRVYNAPVADQVAAIWVEGNNSNIPFEREIIVHAHSGQRHKIKHYFGCYDPLQYPLLFPNGEVGWHQDIKRQNTKETTSADVERESINASVVNHIISSKDIFVEEREDVREEKPGRVSCREYYCQKFQIKSSRQSVLLSASRLLQQYAVDMYIKLETTRLDFYRRRQAKIRSEMYQGIVDSVVAGETRGSEVGKRIVLPASFVGGPRDMRRRYLDAMALVQRFGKPDLFLTMTCNPEWQEIKELLQEGQLPQDRPDLTARVFRAKIQDLKDQLFKKEIFGKVAAHVHVIEFQKRGLPHAHMLIVLKSDNKITTPDQYDKYVCAEIPDPTKHPLLYDMVLKHMMHGPCGSLNPKNPCMVNGACKSHYPREFSSRTLQGKDSYPVYRRRNDNMQVLVRNAMLDNRWVVPYNPYLLTRYNCHINVEICSGLKAVKYLYKYIYKGHDKVAIYIACNDGEYTIDEIQQFQDARWVSAQESMWRIFEFHLNEMYPSVVNLQLHLPNKQTVSYWEHQNLENLIHWEYASRTMLTEFFRMCLTDPKVKAKNILYREFPEQYVWEKQGKYWKERKRGDVIGRINGANPIEGERYYLRLLLNHVKSPSSFDDLLTINGFQYPSFKEAAQRGDC